MPAKRHHKKKAGGRSKGIAALKQINAEASRIQRAHPNKSRRMAVKEAAAHYRARH